MMMMMMMMRRRRRRKRTMTMTMMTWWMLSMNMGWHGLALFTRDNAVLILIDDWLRVIPPDEAKRTLIREIHTSCTQVRTQQKGLMFFGSRPLPQLPQVCVSLIGLLILVAKKNRSKRICAAARSDGLALCLRGEVWLAENVSCLFCAPGTHLAQFHCLNEQITGSTLMDFLMIFLSI